MTEEELQREIIARFRARRPPLDPALFRVPIRDEADLAHRRDIVNRYLTDWRGRIRVDW